MCQQKIVMAIAFSETVTEADMQKAIDTALARLQPGDLCLVLVDQVEEALAHLARRVAEAPIAA